PTTLSRLAAREVPYAHVNARVSERSFKRWQRLPGVAASIFGTIQTALCQSAADANRLATLGVGETSVTGNIKFDAPPPSADPQAVADLKAAIGGQPVWVAASIHKEEADEVVSVHHALCARHDGLITLCVPRHPAAADAVEAAFPGAVRRSTGALPRPGIYLADTFGEMGTMLSLSPVVFLGGSLVRRGGHNPAEPAAFGAAIVTGPSHGPMFQPFLDAGAAQMVSDSRGLCEVVDGLLRDPERCARMGAAASAVRQAQMGALDRTMDGLRGILADAAATA
ncbi:MAG: glycosyltransferase N-terminal domain-containing protein, partial [Pseudomonadota bacterium]